MLTEGEEGVLRNEILSLIPSGVGVFDVTGGKVRTEYVNDGYYQMIGAHRENRQAYNGGETLAAVHPDDRPALLEEAKASMREKRLFSYRFRVLDGQGAYRWIAIRANHLALDDDTERFYASYYDIDELVRSQESRIESERLRMKSLQSGILSASCFNVTDDTNVELNNDANLNYRAQGNAEIFDEAVQAEPEVVHQRPETLKILLSAASQIPDHVQRRNFIRECSHVGMIRNYEAGKRERILEYRRWTGKGLIWVSTRIVMLPDPDTGSIIAFYYTTDINDRVIYRKITGRIIERDYETLAYFDLRSEKLYLRRAGEPAGIGFDEADMPSTLAQAIETFVMPGEAESVRADLEISKVISKLDTDEVYSVYYTSRQTDVTLPGHPNRRMKCDMSYLDPQHDIIVFLQRDVTAIFERERENHERMAVALSKAEESNRSKTEFVSRISHDIRTPISIISSVTEFAFEDLADEEKLKDDLAKIRSADTFLLSLINDVLDISKIDSGKIELDPQPYPYEEYTSNVRNILEPMCAEKGLSYEIVRSNRTGTIVADKVRLNQITLNLLSNAVKYTPPGGKVTYTSISEDLPDKTIRFGFEISDTGIGMSEEFQKSMFEPFSQEYDNPKRPSGLSGTGLGLAIVKRMVDIMGGTISVISELGKGTTVRCQIVFPDARSIARPAPEDAASGPGASGGRRLSGKVLLCEDNEINTYIAVRIITSFGLEVDCEGDGKKALDRFAASEPGEYGAILMDIQMPVMDGYEATRRIRALERPDAVDIPIIAMTADAFADAMRRAEDAGVDEYLVKPLDPALLYGVLERMMGDRGDGPAGRSRV